VLRVGETRRGGGVGVAARGACVGGWAGQRDPMLTSGRVLRDRRRRCCRVFRRHRCGATGWWAHLQAPFHDAGWPVQLPPRVELPTSV